MTFSKGFPWHGFGWVSHVCLPLQCMGQQQNQSGRCRPGGARWLLFSRCWGVRRDALTPGGDPAMLDCGCSPSVSMACGHCLEPAPSEAAWLALFSIRGTCLSPQQWQGSDYGWGQSSGWLSGRHWGHTGPPAIPPTSWHGLTCLLTKAGGLCGPAWGNQSAPCPSRTLSYKDISFAWPIVIRFFSFFTEPGSKIDISSKNSYFWLFLKMR